MSHEPSVREIEQACAQLGIDLTDKDAQKICDILAGVIQKTGSRDSDVPRYLERPEEVRPSEARQILHSLWRLRLRLDYVRYQSPRLDTLIDDLVEELEPLSQGVAGMKLNYRHLHLFARLAALYLHRFGHNEKLTEKSRGTQFIAKMLALASIHVPPRTLRLWTETRLADIASEQVNLETDVADFMAQMKVAESSKKN